MTSRVAILASRYASFAKKQKAPGTINGTGISLLWRNWKIDWLERSPAIVTALAPRIGYAKAAELSKEAVARGVTIRELVAEMGLLGPDEIERVLDLAAMTDIGVPGDAEP